MQDMLLAIAITIQIPILPIPDGEKGRSRFSHIAAACVHWMNRHGSAYVQVQREAGLGYTGVYRDRRMTAAEGTGQQREFERNL